MRIIIAHEGVFKHIKLFLKLASKNVAYSKFTLRDYCYGINAKEF